MKRLIDHPLAALFIFVAIIYTTNGFYFGGGNNIEELPVIYNLADIYTYDHDPFIEANVRQFNAITIYTSALSLIAKLTGIQGLKISFFLLHFIILCLIFIGFQSILRLIAKKDISPFFGLTSILILYIGEAYLQWIPNQRGIFAQRLDPEFVMVPFLIWSFFYYLQAKHFKAVVILFFGALIHPLYILPMVGAFIFGVLLSAIVNKEAFLFKSILLYLLSVLPYSILLWYFSRQTIDNNYNASLIHEFVRAPHHLRIPSLLSENRIPYLRFLEMSIAFISISWLIFSNKKILSRSLFKTEENHNERGVYLSRFYFALIALLLYLIFASFISSFTRVQLIVDLTPYRMGVTVVILSFLLLATAMADQFNWSEQLKAIRKGIILLAFTGCLTFSLLPAANSSENKRADMVSWIKSNTPSNSYFLNYSAIDIRTECGRSDFFKFKTIPVYADAQIQWYERLCTYYAVPENIRIDYPAVREKIRNANQQIDLEVVLQKIKGINFVLVDKHQRERLKNINLPTIYQNNSFEIFQVSEPALQ